MSNGWLRERLELPPRDVAAVVAWLVASAVILGALALVWEATLTHDEAVYVDIARHPLTSDYYPGDLFLRHPPLGLGLLAAWEAAGLALRAWPIPWALGGVGLLVSALRAREGSMWVLAPVVASPVLLATISVSMYPPLFAFSSLAAWGWAKRRPIVEAIGWNAAVLTHELALLVLAFWLAPRAIGYLRERERSVRRWSSLVLPYPAAVAWGLVMIAGLLQGGDPRGGILSTLWDPSTNALAVVKLEPVFGLVFLATLAPIMRWPRAPGHPARGLAVAAVVAIVVAPFYRYMLALVPLMAIVAAADPPRWTDRERWPSVLALSALLATGGALALTSQGIDTLNAADVPGLEDHEAGVELLGANETVIVRSPVSYAHVLRGDGWRLASTGDAAPTNLTLERGTASVTLLRAETLARMEALIAEHDVDAIVLPSSWDRVITSLEASGWTPASQQDRLTRLEPS